MENNFFFFYIKISKEKIKNKVKEKIAATAYEEEMSGKLNKKVRKKVNKNKNENKNGNYNNLKLRKVLTIAASLMIVLFCSIGVYAVIGEKITGKPVIEWLGIKFSDDYNKYRKEVVGEELSNKETSINLTGTVCDEGFTILEFDVTISDEDKEKLKLGEKILTDEYMNAMPEELGISEEDKQDVIKEYGDKTIDSIYLSFNNKLITDETGTYLEGLNNYKIIIDGKEYWIRPRSAQTATKISDNKYKVYQLYFLTDKELGNKKEFNITLNDVVLEAENTQYGSEEVLIPIEGEFNVSVSKEQTLKDTNIFSPEIKDIKHGDLTGKIDKVIDTPLQTIIKISYNYKDVSLNKLSQSWNKDFIDILEYNAYDENGESLGILSYETERKITYANGKEEEWAVGDIGTFINFTNAKMDITEYLIIEKKQNNSKIKVEIKEQSDKKPFDNFEIDLKSEEK